MIPQRTAAQRRLAAAIAAATGASVLVNHLAPWALTGTGLFFIVAPALFAIVLTLQPPARTILGQVARGTGIVVLATSVVLREGVICVLLVSPLIFAITMGVAAATLAVTRRRTGHQVHAAALAALLLLGGVDGLLVDTGGVESVSATAVVPATPAEVEAALAATPGFDARLPAFLRLGFPRPTASSGSGLHEGAMRTIDFEKGSMAFTVLRHGPQRVEFAVAGDSTPIANWVDLQASVVTWRAVPGGTEVTWEVRYENRLGAGFYFRPIERYGFGRMAAYLLDTVATP